MSIQSWLLYSTRILFPRPTPTDIAPPILGVHLCHYFEHPHPPCPHYMVHLGLSGERHHFSLTQYAPLWFDLNNSLISLGIIVQSQCLAIIFHLKISKHQNCLNYSLVIGPSCSMHHHQCDHYQCLEPSIDTFCSMYSHQCDLHYVPPTTI